MRPIFCGNLDYDAQQSDVEWLLKNYGRVERADMKSGYPFIYMDDERDADDAIRRLDRIEFGTKGPQLRVEWSKFEIQEDAARALESMNMSKLLDRVITVEYAIRDDDERGNGYSPGRRDRGTSPAGRGYRGRSPSPYRWDRGIPDYGHGANPNSRGKSQV